MADEASSASAGFTAKMSFNTGNVSQEWKMFKRQLRFYIDSKMTVNQQTERKRIGVLMTALGRDGIDIYDTLFAATADPTYDAIIKAFDDYCSPRKNTVFERSVYFRLRQQSGQSVDTFVLELKKQAAVCEFAEAEREKLLRDMLVIGIRDARLREELLRDPELSLKTALQACKARERSQIEATEIEATFLSEPAAVAHIQRSSTNAAGPAAIPPCSACGYRHGDVRPCPALKGSCNKCGISGHFSRMCKTKSSRKAVQSVEVASEQPPATPQETVETANVDLLRIYGCTVDQAEQKEQRAWYVDLVIGNTTCKFKLDTAADCNTLSMQSYRELKPQPPLMSSSIMIKPYNAPSFNPLGKISVPYQSHQLEFYIMPSGEENLLGFKACRSLNLLKRVSELQLPLTKELFVRANADLFQGEGEIPGENRLYTNPDVSPKIARPRRFAYAIIDRIKETLLTMEKQGIIKKVLEPTPWVSNVTIVEKPDKSLRICLDPQTLNKALQIPKYTIPRPDDILVTLARKKFFTVLDLKSGFWHMKLDENSSKLTTFNSPLGRFRFTRLCYGINCAPEMFMAEMVRIFGDIENVEPYFDDLIIATETEAEHDQTLARVCERARRYNIKFNAEKLQLKKNTVQYLGLIVSDNGLQPAPKHVRAISEMPTPTDKTAVLRFLGLVKFLARFIPNVSALTAKLRALTHKDAEFHWTAEHEKEFTHLKSLIVAKPVLAFFDPTSPVVVQTDSSKDGLGSVLLQNDQPIAFASRALTKTEVRYSQIEKELLAIVFALERFHEFVYGRNVLVQSDHRPLEAILKKDLDRVTARLQRLRLRLLKYDVNVNYTLGRFLYVADALSRAYLTDEEPCLEYQSVIVHAVAALAVSPEKKEMIEVATGSDPVLAAVRCYVQNDEWPAQKSKTSPALARFWAIKSELSVSDNLLFYENRLVVPAQLHKFFLEKLHEGHSGVDKTKRLAREAVFWHGMTVDIADYVLSCTTCQKFARNNTKEKLTPYPLPQYPWQQVAVDIATFNETDLLVVVDKYSNWPEVVQLKTKSAPEVVHHLQMIFARQGIPEIVISDNNPFNSQVYQAFATEWGFQPIFTSPHYPQSNGHAEKTVQTVKQLLRKCYAEKSNFQYALLQYRNTPLMDTGYSPAQALVGRRLRTKLPVHTKLLSPQTVPPEAVIAQKERSQEAQQYYFNQSADDLPELEKTQPVWVKDTLGDPAWQPAVIKDIGPNPRSFLVEKEGEAGTVVRNRRFLRPRGEIKKPLRYSD